MHLILRWVLNALALLLVAYVVPGVSVANFFTALLVAVVLGILNALIRPILLILTLPITIVTLGLFALVINALVFWMASAFVPGFEVAGFWAAFWGSLVLWAVSCATNSLLDEGATPV